MEITAETERMVIIRRCRSLRAWCEVCGCEVDMLTLDEAAATTGLERTTLPASSAVNAWHVREGENGELLVCLNSLRKSL